MIECLRTCACLCLFSHGSWMASAIIRLWRKCLQREMLQANSENISSKSEDWKNIGQVSATTPMFCLMQATCSAVSAKMCPSHPRYQPGRFLRQIYMEGFAGACGLVSFEIQHCWRIILINISVLFIMSFGGQGERVPQWFQLQQRTVIKSTKLPLLKLWFSPWKSSQVEPSKIIQVYPMVSGFWSSLGLAPNFGKIPKTVDPVEPISKRPGHHKSQHWAPSLGVSWLQTNGWPPATEGAWHKHQWHLSNWWIPHEKKNSSKLGMFHVVSLVTRWSSTWSWIKHLKLDDLEQLSSGRV